MDLSISRASQKRKLDNSVQGKETYTCTLSHDSMKARILKINHTGTDVPSQTSAEQSAQLRPETKLDFTMKTENIKMENLKTENIKTENGLSTASCGTLDSEIEILYDSNVTEPSESRSDDPKLVHLEDSDGELDLSMGSEAELEAAEALEELQWGRFTPDTNEPRFSIDDILSSDEVNSKAVENNLSSPWTHKAKKQMPCLKICEAHCNSYGCENKELCDKLHICKQFIEDSCQEKYCTLGHKWDTDHNLWIIEKHFSEPISSLNMLKSLIVFETSFSLSLCENYNGDGCFADNCPSLHICKNFFSTLVGDPESGCSLSCQLSHSILNSSCLNILSLHKIPTNETPRDIALYIINKYPLLYQKDRGSRKKFSSSDSETIPEKNSPTVWSYHYNGDVEITEICYNSVENMCPFEKSGCKRLHSNNHFQWQFSKEGTSWANLSEKQVISIERGYCDPSKDSIITPRLDPTTLEPSLRDLFNIIGHDSWSVDFNTMKMVNSQRTETLHIRRLCTEKVTNVKSKPSPYVYYFLDQDNKWVLYGNTGTSGNEALACSMSSEEIEKYFISNSAGSIAFSNAQFYYTLDFSNMLQRNVQTGTCRKVKRRPKPHLDEEEIKDLPESWKMSTPEQVYRVVLPETSAEFKNIIALLNRKSPFSYSWIKIERIQNIHLWRECQNKVNEMIKTYGDAATVNLQHLFHGTNPENVDRICKENFDWCLNGSSHGQMFGCGSYFSSVSQIAVKDSKADEIGHYHLFVAQVAVGTITQGFMNMVQPPINHQLQLPYDSTVDDIQNPTIFVKYNKQEYYPGYLITFV